jgi:hypothetical protein
MIGIQFRFAFMRGAICPEPHCAEAPRLSIAPGLC